MQFTGTFTAEQLQAFATILEERSRMHGIKVAHQTSELLKALEGFKPVEAAPVEQD